MATIDLATWDGDGINAPSQAAAVKRAYVISRTIDLAVAVTTKGNALAQGDVIEVLNIPAGVMVLAANAKKVTAMTGTSTDLTIDIGVTGGDVDNFVDGWDFDAAAVSSWATPLGIQEPVMVSSADTIDLLFVTQTGTVTGGKICVSAVCVDLDPADRAGLAALGS